MRKIDLSKLKQWIAEKENAKTLAIGAGIFVAGVVAALVGAKVRSGSNDYSDNQFDDCSDKDAMSTFPEQDIPFSDINTDEYHNNNTIKATIFIDDDRWAKHPYGIKFDDEECNRKYYTNGVDERAQCYQIIERAKADGYIIDSEVDEYFY